MLNLIGTHTLTPLGINLTTDREVFGSTLEAALSSGDIPKLKSTQNIDKYADFIITAINTAVDKAIPFPDSQPVSDETLAPVRRKIGLSSGTLRHMTLL